jgi:uncharacterized protein YjdB
VSAGTTVISYTTPSGCVATTTLTVNAIPTSINGTSTLCQGGTATLTDATGSGTWSSGGGAVTVVGSTGVITGSSIGTSVITYTSGGCYITTTVTVNAATTGILGATSLCAGATISLSDGTSGGVWSATGAASVGSTGIVTGVSAGTATISYVAVDGCGAASVITVNASPVAITNNTIVCVGSTNTLSDGTAGGTWSSGNTAIATIGSSNGIVTGVAGGISIISYTESDGCGAAVTVNVATAIGAISGSSSACVGASTTLSDATAGGTWSAGNTNVTLTGTGTTVTVTGASTGTSVVTYTGASGCAKMVTVNVSATPSITSSTFALCANGVTTLTATPSGGTWSLSSSLVAAVVGSTGVITASGTYTGTTTISYTNGGCAATHALTVNANPGTVSGALSECAGVTITVSDATAGGAWSASNSNVTVSGSSITGVSAGASTLTYTLASTGCYVTYPNTVYANPASITGTMAVCAGSTTALTDATSGGLSWTSSTTSVATVINSGVVTGVAAGTATITYKISTGSCYITTTVTVNPVPAITAILGASSVVHGTPITLSDATSGGIWASSNTGVITLSGSTGSPVTATAVTTTGSSVISYVITNIYGCSASATKTLSATEPHPGGSVSGTTTSLFVGATVTLADDELSGLWSSSNTSVAVVDNNGYVTGVAPGIANITHLSTNDQGNVTTSVTPVVVSVVPASISLLPNPNKGTFTVKGTVGSVNDEEVTLEVTDVLGQVIYKSKVTAQNGRINETVTLNNTLANGMYILNVQSGSEQKVFHFVIEQ